MGIRLEINIDPYNVDPDGNYYRISQDGEKFNPIDVVEGKIVPMSSDIVRARAANVLRGGIDSSSGRKSR